VLSIPSLGKVVPRQEVRRSPRVNVKIPFTYRIVENASVAPEPFVGRILDIGYHGVLAEVADEIAPFTELRLEFDLPLVGDRLVDLYGKIVTVTQKAGQRRVGIEFSFVSSRQRSSIQLFVQLLIQGSESRD